MIPVGYLHECFEYKKWGFLEWKERPRDHFKMDRSHKTFLVRWAGKVAGRTGKEGYHFVALTYKGKQKILAVSRVIWAMHNGKWPDHEIDHINRIVGDNRIENLRDVPKRINLENRCPLWGAQNRRVSRSTGVRGVIKDGQKFVAQIYFNGASKYLGSFKTIEEAYEVFDAASLTLRGYSTKDIVQYDLPCNPKNKE